MLAGVPPASARSTSSALAARTSSARAEQRVGHRAAARGPSAARVARARPWLALARALGSAEHVLLDAHGARVGRGQRDRPRVSDVDQATLSLAPRRQSAARTAPSRGRTRRAPPSPRLSRRRSPSPPSRWPSPAAARRPPPTAPAVAPSPPTRRSSSWAPEQVDAYAYGGRVYTDLGAAGSIAEDAPFELWSHPRRRTTTRSRPRGAPPPATCTLPTGSMTTFSGLDEFLHAWSSRSTGRQRRRR